MTPAETTLKTLTDQIELFDPQERFEIYELVDKLERVCQVYSSSAQVAIMIVGLKIGIERGQ